MVEVQMSEEKFWARLQELVDEHGSEASFHRLCALYSESTSTQRKQIRELVNLEDHTWHPPLDSTLVAGETSPFPPEVRVRHSLIFHAINSKRADYRDSLMSIVLIYHSTIRLGIDVIALFDEVAEISPSPMKEIIAAFPYRSPEDRSLWAFSYKEVPTKHGVRYEYIA